MKNKKQFPRLEIKYGLIMGLVSMIWIGLEFFIGRELGMTWLGDVTSVFAMFIPLTVVFLALRQKKKSQGGVLEVLEAVRTGLIIGAISGVMSGIFLGTYLFLNPDVMSGYIDYAVESMRLAGNDQGAIEDAIEKLSALYTPPIQAFLIALGSIGAGVVSAAIIGYFMRTKRKSS